MASNFSLKSWFEHIGATKEDIEAMSARFIEIKADKPVKYGLYWQDYQVHDIRRGWKFNIRNEVANRIIGSPYADLDEMISKAENEEWTKLIKKGVIPEPIPERLLKAGSQTVTPLIDHYKAWLKLYQQKKRLEKICFSPNDYWQLHAPRHEEKQNEEPETQQQHDEDEPIVLSSQISDPNFEVEGFRDAESHLMAKLTFSIGKVKACIAKLQGWFTRDQFNSIYDHYYKQKTWNMLLEQEFSRLIEKKFMECKIDQNITYYRYHGDEQDKLQKMIEQQNAEQSSLIDDKMDESDDFEPPNANLNAKQSKMVNKIPEKAKDNEQENNMINDDDDDDKPEQEQEQKEDLVIIEISEDENSDKSPAIAIRNDNSNDVSSVAASTGSVPPIVCNSVTNPVPLANKSADGATTAVIRGSNDDKTDITQQKEDINEQDWLTFFEQNPGL